MEYVVPSGATKLRGLVGIPVSSVNTTVVVKFTIADRSGRELFSGTVGYNQGAVVDISLVGVDRIRLTVEWVSSVTDPSDKSARAAWAGMRFVS
jgi:hypothetical protein